MTSRVASTLAALSLIVGGVLTATTGTAAATASSAEVPRTPAHPQGQGLRGL